MNLEILNPEKRNLHISTLELVTKQTLNLPRHIPQEERGTNKETAAPSSQQFQVALLISSRSGFGRLFLEGLPFRGVVSSGKTWFSSSAAPQRNNKDNCLVLSREWGNGLL